MIKAVELLCERNKAPGDAAKAAAAKEVVEAVLGTSLATGEGGSVSGASGADSGVRGAGASESESKAGEAAESGEWPVLRGSVLFVRPL